MDGPVIGLLLTLNFVISLELLAAIHKLQPYEDFVPSPGHGAATAIHTTTTPCYAVITPAIAPWHGRKAIQSVSQSVCWFYNVLKEREIKKGREGMGELEAGWNPRQRSN